MFSHEDWLLLILSDGQWHSLAEILRRQPMMAHSRAAGLRAKGYEVEHKTTGRGSPGSWYRLNGLGSAGGETADTAAAAAAPADPSPPLSAEEPWQHPESPGRSESPAGSLPDTRPRVSSSALSGGPGAPLAAGAHPAPLSEPPARVHTQVGSPPVIPAAGTPSGSTDYTNAGGSLSGASAQTGREGHGRPLGASQATPSGSPPAQLLLPGIAA